MLLRQLLLGYQRLTETALPTLVAFKGCEAGIATCLVASSVSATAALEEGIRLIPHLLSRFSS